MAAAGLRRTSPARPRFRLCGTIGALPGLATQKNLYRWDAAADKWSRWRLAAPLRRAASARRRRFSGIDPQWPGPALGGRQSSGADQGDLPPALNSIARSCAMGKAGIGLAAKRALLRIEGQPGSFHLRQENLPGMVSPEDRNAQTVDLEVDTPGRLWVGYSKGIAWLDDQDRWRKLVTDQPVAMLRSFTLAGDDIWVAHRRLGLFFPAAQGR